VCTETVYVLCIYYIIDVSRSLQRDAFVCGAQGRRNIYRARKTVSAESLHTNTPLKCNVRVCACVDACTCTPYKWISLSYFAAVSSLQLTHNNILHWIKKKKPHTRVDITRSRAKLYSWSAECGLHTAAAVYLCHYNILVYLLHSTILQTQ
jgi:hypothetical protein